MFSIARRSARPAMAHALLLSSEGRSCHRGCAMKRRDFLKSAAAVAAGSALPAPAVWSPAKAQSRQETLLIVSESGPNNVDIHGVGTNVPGYEVSWNCYDRLISHEMKTLPNGVQYYDRDKFKMELAEDMNVGDMSATFKLRKDAKFQDGTPVTAKDVKWSLDRAVTVGGFPTFQMGAGSLDQGRAVRRGRRPHRARRLPEEGPPDDPRSRGDRALHHQFRAGEEERHREGPLGARIHQAEHVRQRRLQAHANGHAGAEVILERNDDWKLRAAAEGQAHRLAHGAVGRQPARAARARRRRHLLRAAEQGLRRAARGRQARRSCRRRSPTASSTSA